MSLRVTHARPLAGDEQGVFLLSDPHVGSDTFDESRLRADLQSALRRGDRIVVNGDVFDLILPADRKRYRPSAVHRRLRGRDDLVNAAVEWAEELFAPAAHLLDMVGVGNHEDAAEQHHSVDPVRMLLRRLALPGHVASHGGYCGFLKYRWEGRGRPHTVFYWHGAGKGHGLAGLLGEFSQKATFVEGADTVWFAHRHGRAVGQLEKVSSPSRGNFGTRRQWLVRSGAYLKPYARQPLPALPEGRGGNYAADALCTPYAPGGVRLVLRRDGSSRVELD